MSGPRIIELTSCQIDLGRHQILRSGGAIDLTPLEASLLSTLAEQPGQTWTRDALLDRVWGYRSGVVTRAVDKTVARLRSKLDPDPSAPGHLQNVRGVGYRLEGIVGVVEPTEAGAPPVATERRADVTNLEDWDVRTFVGRAEEGPLHAWIAGDSARLVTLLGPGGIGKTRLARRAGIALASRFPGGVWFVDLTEVRSPDGLVAAVGQTLGVAASSTDPDLRVEVAVSARGSTLLILDNAEQIAAHVAALLGRWTRTLRDARFLVTSRERLRIAGEQCIELQPLAEDEAVRLFVERAREAGADVDVEEQDLLRQLVAFVDRMPLALELAAARVRLFGLRELVARLGRDLSLLQTGRRDVSSREATLQGAIQWSWELLTEEERAVFCQASLFANGFGLEAAESVFDTPASALDVLESLVDKSMVRSLRDAFGRRRFRMYDSIRAFATDRATSFLRQAAPRFARFVAEQHERLAGQLHGLEGTNAFREQLLERDNAIAAFEIATAGDPGTAIRIALALQPVLAAVGPPADAERVLTRTLSLATDRSPTELARALLARGATRSNLALLDGAREDLERALRTVPAGSDSLVAAIRSELGHVGRLQARTAEAFAHYDAALALASPDSRVAAVLHERLGRLCANVDRSEEAQAHLAIALESARALGDSRLEAEVLLDLGWLAESRLEFDLAIDLDEEALALARLAGDRRAEATARTAIGTVQMLAGAFSEAGETLDQAARELATVGNRRSQAIARCHLGICRLASNDHEGALAAIGDALVLLEGVGDEVNIGVIETNMAEALHLRGDLDAAHDVLTRAIARLRRGGVEALLGAAVGQLAAVQADRNELTLARASLLEAETTLAKHPRPIELRTLAIRRLHLRIAEAPPAGTDAGSADGAAVQEDPTDPVFVRLACRQLAAARARRGPSR